MEDVGGGRWVLQMTWSFVGEMFDGDEKRSLERRWMTAGGTTHLFEPIEIIPLYDADADASSVGRRSV